MERSNYLFDEVRDYLKALDENDLISLWNRYCEECNNPDGEIWTNDDEFFEIFFTKALDAVRAAYFGDYNFSDDWVTFNGYGNLESFNSPYDHIDDAAMINDIIEQPEVYDLEGLIDELNEAWDEENDEEDDDEIDEEAGNKFLSGLTGKTDDAF